MTLRLWTLLAVLRVAGACGSGSDGESEEFADAANRILGRISGGSR